VTATPPKQAGVCDRDGTALVLREDDRPENVRKRMQEYAAKTEPLKRFYAGRGLVSVLDGLGAPTAILEASRRLLGR
jgi:adenylate kinase